MIPTAITIDEAHALREHAKNRQVLEIGSLLGYSTILLAKEAAHVVSVDPHEGYPENDPRPTLMPFLSNLETQNVRDKITVCVGTDEDVLPLLAPNLFDMAFIDTTGLYDDTLRIMHAVIPHLRHYAILAVHDCGNPDWPGAEQAAKDFAKENHRTFELIDRLAIFKGTW